MFRRCNCSLFKEDVMRGAAKFKQNCLVFVKNYAASETELSSVWWSEVRGFVERNERNRRLTPPGQWFSKWGTWNPRGAWCYSKNIFLGFFFFVQQGSLFCRNYGLLIKVTLSFVYNSHVYRKWALHKKVWEPQILRVKVFFHQFPVCCFSSVFHSFHSWRTQLLLTLFYLHELQWTFYIASYTSFSSFFFSFIFWRSCWCNECIFLLLFVFRSFSFAFLWRCWN